MIKLLKEYVQNYREYRALSKRINGELDRDGIYKYIERHYGFEPVSKAALKQKHG